MTDKRAIRNDAGRAQIIKRIESTDCPFTVSITKGAPRSIEQNKLQRKWMFELAEQGDMTAEEYRGYCKLHFGVAIAKEHDDWAEAYDRIIKPLTYEAKLQMMMEPLDFPVTRIMTTKQKSKYLDAIYVNYTGQGFCLTSPDQ